MQLDEPFPLALLPSRVQDAILNEFKGCYPTFRQMVEVSDPYWMATPGMGPTSLRKIHHLLGHLKRQANFPLRQLTNAELFARLDLLREELQHIENAVKAKIARAASFLPDSRNEARESHTSSRAI
jgi:hypothetical protein